MEVDQGSKQRQCECSLRGDEASHSHHGRVVQTLPTNTVVCNMSEKNSTHHGSSASPVCAQRAACEDDGCTQAASAYFAAPLV